MMLVCVCVASTESTPHSADDCNNLKCVFFVVGLWKGMCCHLPMFWSFQPPVSLIAGHLLEYVFVFVRFEACSRLQENPKQLRFGCLIGSVFGLAEDGRIQVILRGRIQWAQGLATLQRPLTPLA